MSKKLNIIEAMKMPIGTEFTVEFDGEKIPNNRMIVSLDFIGTKEYKTIDWKSHPKDSFMRPFDFLINGVFIPIQQPVSFMEAIANEHNRIKVKLDNSMFGAPIVKELNKYVSVSKMFKNLGIKLSDIGIKRAIDEGKWYIEESEELEDERLS